MPSGYKIDYDMEVVEYIKANIKGHKRVELVEMVKRDLGKDIDYHMVDMIRNKWRLTSGIDTTFKKGHNTWNKGKKGYMGANATSFKKDNKPPNTLPIGAESVEKDGYIFVKVNDIVNGKKEDNWMPKQQVIYEQYHKTKVPKGSIVIFADGNIRNYDIDNLVQVTRAELLYLNRHHLIYNDADLTKVGVTIAKVSVTADKRKKKV